MVILRMEVRLIENLLNYVTNKSKSTKAEIFCIGYSVEGLIAVNEDLFKKRGLKLTSKVTKREHIIEFF